MKKPSKPTPKSRRMSKSKSASPTKTPRKTTRKSPKTQPKTLAEVFQGECSPSTPQVLFDVPVSYNPSEFEGVSPFYGNKPVEAKPIPRSLERVKAMLPLFDADLSSFDLWYAMVKTNGGSYHLGGPKRIERDLRPGRERIKLDFIELPAIKHVYVETLTICNTVGDVVAVEQVNCWLRPGDTVKPSYSLNV